MQISDSYHGFSCVLKKGSYVSPSWYQSNILDILLHTAFLGNTAFQNLHELNVSQEYILIFIIS